MRSLFVEPLEVRRLLATVDLSNLGTGGTVVYGADAGDSSGFSVSGGGDVNGDGYDDVILGAYRAGAAANAKVYAGESYLIFGGPSLPGSIDLASLGTAGIKIYGAEAMDYSGASVSAAGDVNGDGFGDLIIGSVGGDALGNTKNYAGESYLLFGRATLPATIDLAALGIAGVAIFGADAFDNSGIAVSRAGDVNGDGLDDLIVGASGGDASGNSKPEAGDGYLIFGKGSWPTTMSLSSLGAAGMTIFGAESNDQSGISVNSAGDVNGDGFDDLVIGAYTADALGNLKPEAGESYLIFGAPVLPSSLNLASLGTFGITLFGAESGDQSGVSVTGVGDVDGDGIDDLIIGARYADAAMNAKTSAGESYLIFGTPSLPTSIDLNTLGNDGVTIYGAEAGDMSGITVSRAGDVNGDGLDDLLIGAYKADSLSNTRIDAGESYVVFGSSSLPATIDLLNLGTAGITIFGADSTDSSGFAVSAAGDTNGDGFGDLVIGAYLARAAGNLKMEAGESYLVYGQDFTATLTHPGTTASETLTGTSGADVMVGGRGNDTLIGAGEADVLIGGQGDDVLSIVDLLFQRMAGGLGNDTLRLDSSGQTLDLAAISNNRILGIEQIDITGSGNNTLSLSYREVLQVSDESNTLVVHRDAGDTVSMGGGWTRSLNETILGTLFAVYTQGRAILKVQIAEAQVTNRQIFYNRSTSSVFGNGSGNPLAAIDPSKTALLPGQTASLANTTNYVHGLNGLIIDIENLAGNLTASDFLFASWNGIDANGFVATVATPTLTVIPGGGSGGATRVKIEFLDEAIRNTWLRVTLLANANSGLANNDIFYFGNAVADMGVGNIGSPITIRTNATDTAAVRQNQSVGLNSVGITSIFDLNKDGRVNATDTAMVRQNQMNDLLRLFTAPAVLQLSPLSLSAQSASLSTPIITAPNLRKLNNGDDE